MIFRRHLPVPMLFVLLGWLTMVPSDVIAADLRVQFVYQGPAPLLKPGEQFLIDPGSKGVEDIIVYVHTGRGGTEFIQFPPRRRRVKIETFNGQVAPRVAIAQAGDTLVIQPNDQVIHAFNVGCLNNSCDCEATRPNEGAVFALPKSEPAMIPIACNIHPQMKAWLMVLDHPYVAKSDEHGQLEIKDLPDNAKLTFRIYHEIGPIDRWTIDETEVESRRSTFKVTTSTGLTDMGTITLSRDSFRGQRGR